MELYLLTSGEEEEADEIEMKPARSNGEINPAATVDVELEHFTPEHLASKRYQLSH